MLCYLTSFWCMLLLPSTMLAPCWALILLAYVGLPPRCCSNPRVVFFRRSFLLVGRSSWSWKHQSTLFWRCLIGFMLGNFGLHGSCDCAIFEPFDCWHGNMLWVVILLDHPLLCFFLNFTKPTCSCCPIRCHDNACCSIFLPLWSAPQLPSQVMQPKPWCSLFCASQSY